MIDGAKGFKRLARCAFVPASGLLHESLEKLCMYKPDGPPLLPGTQSCRCDTQVQCGQARGLQWFKWGIIKIYINMDLEESIFDTISVASNTEVLLVGFQHTLLEA